MQDVIVRVGAGETALVGYGLLLSRATVDATLGHEYSGPYVACHVEGWRRSWDVTMPNASFYYERDGHRVYPEKILYLNVRRDPGTVMNCAVFVVDNDDFAAVNAREWIYDSVVATSDLRGIRVEGGDALIYTGKAEHIIRSAARASDVAIRRSYLQMLDGVLDASGPVTRADYRSTTDPVPKHLIVDDLLDTDRPNPWEVAGHSFRPEAPTGETV
jgi:hypothetical protein